MGYSVRTLATLATAARQAFTQSVTGAIASVWANTFTVFGKVFALLDFEHELRRQYLYDQLFASTAALSWLTRHGFELGLVQDAGNAAVGNVVLTANPGTVVPLGIGLTRRDGRTYTSLVAVPADVTGNASIPIQADLPGIDGNCDPATTMAVTPNAGVPSDVAAAGVVDAAGLAGGTDPEAVEPFRARVLYRKRNPPQGGSEPDYVKWAGEALSSVKDVWVDSFQNDARSVWVCFTVDDQTSGIPSDVEVTTVQAYVDDSIRRPVTARVFATAPTPVPVEIGILGLSPFTTDVTGAIEAELEALFADDVRPAKPTAAFTLYREQIDAAIARATGVGTFTLSSPATDLTYTIGGQMPVLGDIVYSDS